MKRHSHSHKPGKQKEQEFFCLMAGRGIMLERPSKWFIFKRSRYQPDWWSPSENCYYEVIGTRQRASCLLHLLDLMEMTYPNIVVRPVHPDGAPYLFGLSRRSKEWRGIPFGEDLQRFLDKKNIRLAALAKTLGVSPSYLSGALHAGWGAKTLIPKLYIWFSSHGPIDSYPKDGEVTRQKADRELSLAGESSP